MPFLKSLNRSIAKLFKTNSTIQQFNNLTIRSGFTLIEILVTLTIITVLTSIGAVSINNTLDRGRDSKRKQDLATIKQAATLYFEENGHYPPNPATNTNTAFASDAGDNWIPDLVPTYIKQLPKDPKQTSSTGQVAAATTTKITLRPSGNGDINHWRPEGCSVNYQCVNEEVTNNATYVSSWYDSSFETSGGDIESYAFPKTQILSGSTGISVDVSIVARADRALENEGTWGCSFWSGWWWCRKSKIELCFNPGKGTEECQTQDLSTDWASLTFNFTGLKPQDFETAFVTLRQAGQVTKYVSQVFIDISYTPFVEVNLTANPTYGVIPLATNLTAQVNGSSQDAINYYFWWNCDDDNTKLNQVKKACGDPADAVTGAQFENVFTETKTVAHTYDTTGTYSAKVLVERGKAAVEKRATVTANAISTTVCEGSDLCLEISPDLSGGVTQTSVGQINYQKDQFKVGTAWAISPNSIRTRGYARFPLNNLPADARISKVELLTNANIFGSPKMTVAPFGIGNGTDDPQKYENDLPLLFQFAGSAFPDYNNSEPATSCMPKCELLGAGREIGITKQTVNRFSLAVSEDGTNSGPYPLNARNDATFTSFKLRVYFTLGPAPTPTPGPAPSPLPSPSPGPSPSPTPTVGCGGKTNVYCYITIDHLTFTLWAKLENSNDPEIYNKPGATCSDSSTRPDDNYNYCLKPD